MKDKSKPSKESNNESRRVNPTERKSLAVLFSFLPTYYVSCFSVIVKSFTRFATKIAGGNIVPQERAGTIFVVAKSVVESL